MNGNTGNKHTQDGTIYGPRGEILAGPAVATKRKSWLMLLTSMVIRSNG